MLHRRRVRVTIAHDSVGRWARERSVTLLSPDWFVAGGTTAVRLKAEGFLAGATVAENEAKTIAELTVGVNQARAAIEASHAQHFAGGGSLRPSLETGGRFDGGDGETGAGLEVGGGLTYAAPGSGLTVAGIGRALVVRDGNYSEWGLSGLDPARPERGGPRPDDERAADLGRDGERGQRAVGARHLRPAGRRQPAGRPRRCGDRLRPAGVRHGRRADPVRGSLAHRRGGAQPEPGRPPGAGTGVRSDPWRRNAATAPTRTPSRCTT